jgi:hypothetical protein
VSDFAAYLAAAVLLGFAAFRLVTERRRAAAYPARGALYGFVVCEGLAMALLATGTSNLLVRLGVSALLVVLAGEIVRTAGVGFLMGIGRTLLPGPRRAGARPPVRALPTALAVQAAMIGTFLAAHPHTARDWSLQVHGSGQELLLSAHDAVFALYSVCILVEIARALSRESKRLGPGPLRTGARLMLAAACVAVLWAAWTGDDIANVLRTGVQDGSEDTVSNVLGAVCASAVVAGATVTRWGEALAAPLRWWRAYRAYAALGPLWRALHAQFPQIALAERRRGWSVGLPPNIAFALYRRVIEIDDGRLALRPYAPAHTAIAALIGTDPGERRPHRRCAPDEDALIEAASIAAALANLRSGHRVGGGRDTQPSNTAHEAGSVDDEAAWLVQVSRAFTRSPVVPRVLGDLGRRDGLDVPAR